MNKIIKNLKHFFIPHEHNDYKPHFFREISVTIIIVSAIILLVVSAGTKLYINKTDMTAAVLPAVLVDLTNNVRHSSGQIALARNPVLDRAAQMKADDMATYGYFAHTSPQGMTPWHWFSQAGYYFVYAGENLAVDFSESADVENAWLNSPTHKANILNSNFTEIGIATREGYYNGHPTVYVVQMFAKPVFASEPIKNKDQTKNAITPISEEQTKKTEPIKEIAVIPASSVKGESIILDSELETISETEDFISVKNTSVEPESEEIPVVEITEDNQKYSTWSERFVFLAPIYTNIIYKIFIYIVVLALILMTFIEIKRQHPKNIMYGVFLIVIIFCLIYINKTIFMIDFLIK